MISKEAVHVPSDTSQESQSKTVTLHDDDPKNIARLIIWFYYRDYDIHDSRNGFGAPSVSEMLDSGSAQYQASLNKSPSVPPSQTGLPTRTEMFDVHTEMFIIADKYAVSPQSRISTTLVLSSDDVHRFQT